MFLEDFRHQREEFERLGKQAPRLAARPPNAVLAKTGETCRTCAHAVRREYANVHHKCGLNRDRWTASVNTDIRLKDAACNLYENEK